MGTLIGVIGLAHHNWNPDTLFNFYFRAKGHSFISGIKCIIINCKCIHFRGVLVTFTPMLLFCSKR